MGHHKGWLGMGEEGGTNLPSTTKGSLGCLGLKDIPCTQPLHGHHHTQDGAHSSARW